MRIFHVATLADWQEAKRDGSYTTSTYGASLDEVGFIHAARREQVAGVVSEHYADVEEPILLLEIETDLLDVSWREDDVDGERFPHIYGPLSPRAVVAFHPARSSPNAMSPWSRPPREPLASAFFGLSAVVFAAALTLLVSAVVVSTDAGNSLQPNAARTVLWALTLTAGIATLASFVVALSFGRRAR